MTRGRSTALTSPFAVRTQRTGPQFVAICQGEMDVTTCDLFFAAVLFGVMPLYVAILSSIWLRRRSCACAPTCGSRTAAARR